MSWFDFDNIRKFVICEENPPFLSLPKFKSNQDDDNPLTGVLNSFVSDVCMEHVRPLPGSIVSCSLAGNLEKHSGIYIGYNKIIELNGDGYIKKVSGKNFLEGSDDGGFPFRTGINVYVACDNKKPIQFENAKKRAKDMCGSKEDYDLAFNNCHGFVSYCITGNKQRGITTYDVLNENIIKHSGTSNITWRVWDYDK